MSSTARCTRERPIEPLGLTEREKEVLQTLISLNGDYQKTADKLGIGITTVKTHVNWMYYKLNASSKLELCLTAFRRGILGIEDLLKIAEIENLNFKTVDSAWHKDQYLKNNKLGAASRV